MARLKLRQAFGRLVRRADDRGVFVLLDAMLPSRLASAFPDGVEVVRCGLAEGIATTLHVSPLLLALLIAPLATELPEMSNSFLWLYQKKDTLAVGNVTGAMVFQSTVPVTIGLIGTEWTLDSSALMTMGLAMAASAVCFAELLKGGHWRPWLLIGCAILYVGFTFYAWSG